MFIHLLCFVFSENMTLRQSDVAVAKTSSAAPVTYKLHPGLWSWESEATDNADVPRVAIAYHNLLTSHDGKPSQSKMP